LIVTARFIVVGSGTSECGFFSVRMVIEVQTSCCVGHRATAITSRLLLHTQFLMRNEHVEFAQALEKKDVDLLADSEGCLEFAQCVDCSEAGSVSCDYCFQALAEGGFPV
jgi:hypothetical protein